ncbi:hypothetical protein SAY87_026828 [Trapa incisa]|uniref:TSL-kinase interacting protein 1 n=1 Tax=Trapa incisa TaxID=236973 RepID=A0AAN7JLC3_9MYRT|nr:hypothetical protein SAY87_026828 [Trapa incisa]
MRPARQRKVRVQGNNPHTVPHWSENVMEFGGQDHEPKPKGTATTGTTIVSAVGLSPVLETNPSTKIKLQLFPIDEATRGGLEKDGHNPYLELTLRARKKISSVLKHIKSKWGSSSIARGEPVLFPYNTPEKTSASHRWTVNDIEVRAGEVYAAIGCPTVFRLRYAWSSDSDTTSCPLGAPPAFSFQAKSTETCLQNENQQPYTSKENNNLCQEEKQKEEVMQEPFLGSSKAMQSPHDENIFLSHHEVHTRIQESEERPHEAEGQSVAVWADSLTNISIGGLFSEASLLGKFGNFDSKTNGSNAQPSSLISDSLDAFITANLKCSQSPMLPPSEPPSSILDAEDTCHAFSFKRPLSSLNSDFPTSRETGYMGACLQETGSRACKLPKKAKDELMVESQLETSQNDKHQEFQMDHTHPSRVYNDESSLGLTGINWTDSLGPFDFGLPLRKVECRDSVKP